MRIVLLAAFGALLSAPLLAQQGASVTIQNFKFGPDSVSAAAKAPITWTNKDGAPHQIVIAAKNLKTPVLNNGQSAQLSLADAGTYDYVCGIHPSMKGKIAVK
jgi:plastocyanin